MAPKLNNIRKNNPEKENQEQFVLMRDEASQVLILGESKKTLSVKKGVPLAPGITVSLQDDNRNRWRGPVLAIGTEAHCSKIMSTIENSSSNKNVEVTSSKTKEPPKSVPSTTVRSQDTQQGLADEGGAESFEGGSIDEESSKSSDDEIIDDEEMGQDEIEKENQEEEEGLSVVEATDISTVSHGTKRSLEEAVTNPIKKKKLSASTLTVPYSTYSKLEQKCLALEAQVALYEQEWMPRPKDPHVIQYLIEITDILRGIHDNDDSEDKDTVLNIIMNELSMTAEDLGICHRKSATATARQIMKFLFPNPTTESKLRLKNKSFRNAVIKYTRLSNPSDPTADVDIRHAMGNYFASLEYKTRKSVGSDKQNN